MDGFSKLDIFKKNKNVQNGKTERNVFSGTRKIFLFFLDFQQSMNGAKKENEKTWKKWKKTKKIKTLGKSQKSHTAQRAVWFLTCFFKLFLWFFLLQFTRVKNTIFMPNKNHTPPPRCVIFSRASTRDTYKGFFFDDI